MGSCCSGGNNEGLSPDEQDRNLEVGELVRMQQGGDDGQTSSLQLILKCRNLRPLPQFRGIGKFGGGVPTHLLTSINPYVVVHEVDEDGKKKGELGKTEVKYRDHNPQFVRTVTTMYEFNAMSKQLRFDLVHDTGLHGQLIGTCTTTLKDIINTEGEGRNSCHLTFMKKVQSKGRHGETIEIDHVGGELFITSEEISKNEGPQYEVVIELGCSKLDSKNYMGRGSSDPFLTIGRVIEGQFQPVVKTEYVEGTLACTWKTIVIKLERLCKADFNSWLLFEVWDYENSGKHQLIGYTRQTLATLLSGVHTSYDLINDNYAGGSVFKLLNDTKPWTPYMPYTRSGILHTKSISIDVSHSFLEFVKAGFDINVTICVDFSSSNGDVNSPESLHYLHEGGDENEYVAALKAVIKVLGQYDRDQEFPFYGFGACPQNDEHAVDAKGRPVPQSIFPVTGDWYQLCVNGIEGVIDAYWSCLKQVTLCEPSNFATFLEKVFRSVSSRKDLYQIALIVTDGQCSDMQATIDMIVSSSEEPISIVIIGVGDGPFEKMEELSADDKPLRSSTKETMKRDIVGFVPFKSFKNDPEEFARETLKEVPKQFTSWAKIHKVKPEDAKKEEKKVVKKKEKKTEKEVTKSPVEQDLEGILEVVEDVGWESFSDDESGRKYYYHSETKESRWEMPEGYKGRSALTSASKQEVRVRPIVSTSPETPQTVTYSSPSKLAYTRLGSPSERQSSKGPSSGKVLRANPEESKMFHRQLQSGQYVPPQISPPGMGSRRGSASGSRRHSMQ